ncbi:MAG: hypothetical protein DI538_06455 [Azospira oryzae]|nr:MAG: hypothetical protein DI538_06455 [Azospira oryzae]
MKPNRIHWIILYLFISLLTIAQGTNHQQKLNKKIDSAIQIINQQSDRKVKEYQRKTDSLNSAAYIQALERANTIQSGNNAYYSILFGGFGLMTTAIAVFIVINFVSSKQEFKKDLKRQKESAEKFIEEQNQQFTAIFNANNTKLTATIDEQREQLTSLLEQNKVVIDDLIKNAEEKVNALEIEVGKKDDNEIQQLRNEIENLKKISASTQLNEPLKTKETLGSKTFTIKCVKCTAEFSTSGNTFFNKTTSTDGKYTIERKYRCPKCKQVYRSKA